MVGFKVFLQRFSGFFFFLGLKNVCNIGIFETSLCFFWLCMFWEWVDFKILLEHGDWVLKGGFGRSTKLGKIKLGNPPYLYNQLENHLTL